MPDTRQTPSLRALAEADRIMARLYGEHWEVSRMHPIVPPGRIRDAIASALDAAEERERERWQAVMLAASRCAKAATNGTPPSVLRRNPAK